MYSESQILYVSFLMGDIVHGGGSAEGDEEGDEPVGTLNCGSARMGAGTRGYDLCTARKSL